MAFCTQCGTSVPEGVKFCTECGNPIVPAQQPAYAPPFVPPETPPVYAPPSAQPEVPPEYAPPFVPPETPPAYIPPPAQPEVPPAYAPPFVPPETPPTYAPPPAPPETPPEYSPPAYTPMQEAPPPAYAPPPAQQTAAKPVPDSTVLGTGAFIGFSILFAIPVIGWLACIILSFTGGNLNRRNFARSRLFFLILGIICAVAAYFVLRWVLGEVADYLNKVSDGAFGESGGLKGILDFINNAGQAG